MHFKIFRHKTLTGKFGRIITNGMTGKMMIAYNTVPELFAHDCIIEHFMIEYPEINFDDYQLIEVEIKQVY